MYSCAQFIEWSAIFQASLSLYRFQSVIEVAVSGRRDLVRAESFSNLTEINQVSAHGFFSIQAKLEECILTLGTVDSTFVFQNQALIQPNAEKAI